MALKIYTRTGDGGKTSLIGGTKVSKSHIRIGSYGTIDELNSYIGLLNDQVAAGIAGKDAEDPEHTPGRGKVQSPEEVQSPEKIRELLKEIQDRLFTIGASLACDPDKESRMKIPDLKEEDVALLETTIDAMSEELPPMKSFILPGGHLAISTAHITRCVCRRAERICVEMLDEGLFVEPLVIKYLNRLSDYLFILARWLGRLLNVAEIPWKART